MDKITTKLLCAAIFMTVVLLIIALSILNNLPSPDNETIIKYYTFKFEVIKTIFIGFLIGAIGIIIPQVLSATKYNFEFKREGRRLYSEVKTGVEYLPYKLPFLNFKESIEVIEKLHQLKHLGELYEDDKGNTYKNIFEERRIHNKLIGVRKLIIQEEYINASQREKIMKLEERIKKFGGESFS